MAEEAVYSVSALNREVARLLKARYPAVWVEGEISNLAAPASGHLYFTLKDENAQLRCALFRGQRARLGFKPGNGMQVKVRGDVGLFEQRGDFQMVVSQMEEAGEGALRRAYEALRLKLQQEGLFAQEQKQPIPALPSRIGIVTSASGAAVRDLLTVLQRRFAAVPVIIYPAQVQGELAAASLCRAVRVAVARRECDVLIIARGGGSLEDLWPFNDEQLARVIHACPIPVISGVGHEVDFTICDAVADLRAATPSAAAEAAVPDSQLWLARFRQLEQRLAGALQRAIDNRSRQLDWLQGRLEQQHPRQQLDRHRQRLQQLEMHLQRNLQLLIERRKSRYMHTTSRLARHDSKTLLGSAGYQLEGLNRRLRVAMEKRLQEQRYRLGCASQSLETVSPLATLSRGYAIVQRPDSNEVIRSARDIRQGERVRARLARGELICKVESVQDDD